MKGREEGSNRSLPSLSHSPSMDTTKLTLSLLIAVCRVGRAKVSPVQIHTHTGYCHGDSQVRDCRREWNKDMEQ